MVVDWSTTGTMLQGWGTLGGALAVAWAAKKGADTFTGWKLQKVTERKIEQSERILTATYRARRALSYVRGVMMWGHELEAAEPKARENQQLWNSVTEFKQRRLVMAQAYFIRLSNVKEERLELEACLPMARALFGEVLETAIDRLLHQFWMVQVNVDSYIDDEEQVPNFSKEIRRAMYDVDPRDGERNTVTDAVNEAIKQIETVCLPVLRT